MGEGSSNPKRLSAAFVRSVKTPGKYHDNTGTGLFLRVDPGGGRFWIQRTTIDGRRREIGLGSFPTISLADAREAANENKRLIRAGHDPIAAKQRDRRVLTFSQAVERYLEKKEAEFRNEKHLKQWRSTLDTYASPIIGKMQAQAITLPDIVKVLEPIWTTKTETASRLRGRIESVLSWATVAGYRTGENPARWKGNLDAVLPKPGKVAKAGNFPAVPIKEAADWFENLQSRDGMAAQALQFLTLCASRSGEVRGMTWQEVDWEADGGPIWTIPAIRMKSSSEHRVPLSKAAQRILERLPRMKGTDYVFFAPMGGQLSDMTISAVMRRMQETAVKEGRTGWLDPKTKRPAVPHGLRSTFRDWCAENGIDHVLAEMALAHRVGSDVERAYRRSDLLQRRRDLLEQWSRFLKGRA
ncbi:tyrosine-type recombinase/integrase [Roseibium aquae]|uniref:tyrosine-type recombinase/integrase n=1 Tax=Roseibium aquae TaxID=1323746 RepID=UPI00123D399C